MTRDYSFTKHRIFQWMGILLALGIIAVGYWYYQSQASTLNKSPTGSLTSGLVGYWTFDGADTSSTTATDRSGNSNIGTLTNGPTTTEGKVGQALSFDGVNDYVAVASSPSLTFGSSPHTVSFWFKVNTAFNSSSATSVPLITRRDSDEVNFSCTLRGTDYANGSGGAGTMQIKYESQVAVAAVYWHTTQNSWAANVWYHVVIIINTDGTNSNVYINGVAAKGGSSGGTTIYDTNYASEWRLGRGDFDTASNLSGVKYLSGSLDEARIYNTALTATQIQSLYALGQSDKTNSSVSQPQGTGRLDSGLAGYWALDNGSGTSATDSSTNGNTGTLTNGPTWTTGQIGGAVSFDGTDDYLYVSSAAPLAIGVGSKVSTSFWYTANVSNGTTQTIYQRAGGACSQYIANITGGASTDTLIFYYRDTGCGGIDTYSVSSITKNTWHHVVSTYDTITGVLSVYVDGVRVATTTSVPSSSISDGVTLTIGAGQGGTNFFGGTLDEFRFYNRVLSPDEVSQLYRLTAPTGVDTSLKGYWSFNAQDMSSTTAYDRSGAGNTGTLTSGPAITEGKSGQALSFDGNNDYVNIPYNANLNLSSAITLSAWVKTTKTTKQVILNRTFGSNPYNGYELNVSDDYTNCSGTGSTGRPGFWIGATSASLCAKQRVDDGVWHLVTGSYDGTTGRIYVDGVLNSSAAMTNQLNNTSSDLRIGTDGVALFQGSIDEVRIYNTALTAAQIKALYDTGQSDKTNSSISQPQGTGRLDSGLAGYWALDDGTSGATPTTAADSSTSGNTGALTNGPTWTTGQIGNAVDLDGNNDYVSASGFNKTLSSATFSAWVNLDSKDNYDGIIFSRGSSVTGMNLSGLNALGYSWNGDSSTYFWESGLSVPTGSWAFIAVTVTPSNATAYLWTSSTGLQSATRSGSHSAAVIDALMIGQDSGGGRFIDGRVDDARLYDRGLSADEVSQLYRLTSPTGVDTSLKGYWSFNGRDVSGTTAYDRSGAGNTGTLANGPTITEGKSGQALSFDGSDDYVDLGNPAALQITGDITISGWVKMNTFDTTNGDCLISKWGGGGSNDAYLLCSGTTKKATFSIRDSSQRNANGTTVMEAGKWYLITGVRSGNNLYVYLNGVLDGTGTAVSATNNPSTNVEIGRAAFAASLVPNASIDEVRIYNRALDASEITALYNAGR